MLNVIPLVDQDTYRLDFQNASTWTIFLHAVAKKVGTSNKVTITCVCKKLYNLWSGCKFCKNKVNYSQYYYLVRQNCSNAVIERKDIDAAMVSKSESGEDNS